MRFLKLLANPFQTALKQTLESFIYLETADNNTTFAARDGSLVTVVRMDGSRQIIGEEEYNYIITAATLKMGTRFDRPGHTMQVYFGRDPSRMEDELERLVTPSRKTAEAIELDVDDLFEERRKHLNKFLSYEEAYFVLWTRPSSLTKAELERIAKERKNNKNIKKWANAPFSQDPMAALDALRTRHKSYVSAITNSLDELSMKAEVMEVHDALRVIKDSLFPTRTNRNWRPCLPGDPIPPRAQSTEVDASELLWPPLHEQLIMGDAHVYDNSIVRIGDMIWAGADMVLAPMDPAPFTSLLNRLFDAKIPYRISFLIEGGGVHGTAFKKTLSTFLGFTNAVNKQVKYSLEGLETMSRSEPVVKLRVSVSTWAPRRDINLLKERQSSLLQAVEAWGYCQVSDVTGDPLDCVMSSALGIHPASTAPAAIAPMVEVMKLLPWQRPSSPFQEGAILLRTPDGKVWPYQTGSNLTTTWFDLIFAQPGAGKSVLMNALNLGTILSPGLSRLPYVAVVDIGPSSSGLISLIKEALPAERSHEAAYYRLQMSSKYAINPFDTQLGCRSPLTAERSYLVELLTLLCTPPSNDRPYDGIQQLAGFVVDEMFRFRQDDQASAEANGYLPRIDDEVDEAIRKHNVHLPSDPYWWDVVDKLFDLGLYHEATLAQRYAVPTLSDAITASRRPQIQTLMEETSVGSSTENIISAFERMITSAIREYPILAGVTKFDIAGARICSLDLMDVAPQGDDTADRQTAIMYMLARHALVRSWWMGPDTLKTVPQKYRSYHEVRLQDIGESSKRLCYDEFHRTSKSRSVRGQVIRDVREGRKRGVQIVLASQLIDDFDDDMIDLATGVWVLGTAVSENAVEKTKQRFGLSDTARNIIRYRLTGPRSSGAPMLFVLGTTNGRYEQHLISTLGPIELWALSTSSEDVAIRSRLYSKIGAGRARRILAAYFPGGSARSEIKRRVLSYAEDQDVDKASTTAVVEEIVDELVQASLKTSA